MRPLLRTSSYDNHRTISSRFKGFLCRNGTFIAAILIVLVLTSNGIYNSRHLQVRTGGITVSVDGRPRQPQNSYPTPGDHVHSTASFSFSNSIDLLQNDESTGLETENLSSKDMFFCNQSHPRYDLCVMRGDVRVIGGEEATCTLYSSNPAIHAVETVQPYPRKGDPAMLGVRNVTLQCEDSVPTRSSRLPACEVQYLQPGLMFSVGGYSGNLYHDFNDVLIPLFISSYHYKGEVIFLITDWREWWIERYSPIFRQLSKYQLVDLHSESRVLCLSDLTSGLQTHDELGINPDLMPDQQGIVDFRELLHHAFWDPKTIAKAEATWIRLAGMRQDPFSSPRLLILARLQNRVIMNQEDLVDMATAKGFDVWVLAPTVDMSLTEIYHSINSADIVVGVHGAALTHILFMRPAAVLIQIVLIGVESPALIDYGDPAVKMHLQYIHYRVKPEESTLTKTYNITDPIITNPEAIASESWEVRRITYMEGQNVTLDLERFAPYLDHARKLSSPE